MYGRARLLLLPHLLPGVQVLHGEGREEVLPLVGDHALHLQADVQAWVGVGGVGAEVCEGGDQQWMRDI